MTADVKVGQRVVFAHAPERVGELIAMSPPSNSAWVYFSDVDRTVGVRLSDLHHAPQPGET